MRLSLLVAALSMLAYACSPAPVSVFFEDAPYTQDVQGLPVIRVGDAARVIVTGPFDCDAADGTTLVPSDAALVSVEPNTVPATEYEVPSGAKRFVVTGLQDGVVTLVGTCDGRSGEAKLRVGVPLP